jgi:XTP/dITP diphosphohydrolase
LASRTIVVASNNEHKIKEIKEILNDFEIKKASDVVEDFEVEEDGDSFCENAYLKAKALSKYTDSIVLADDSGLEVFALNSEPGIFSSRYSQIATDKGNVDKLLKNMKGIKERTARFVCCMVAIINDSIIQKEGYVYGVITEKPIGESGFGYDSVFIPNGYSSTFAQMDSELKNKLSHRRSALELINKELRVFL